MCPESKSHFDWYSTNGPTSVTLSMPFRRQMRLLYATISKFLAYPRPKVTLQVKSSLKPSQDPGRLGWREALLRWPSAPARWQGITSRPGHPRAANHRPEGAGSATAREHRAREHLPPGDWLRADAPGRDVLPCQLAEPLGRLRSASRQPSRPTIS